jgi:hypothetical protein
MPRKKKVVTTDEIMQQIAADVIEGKYGFGLDIKNNVNSLGYGIISPEIKKRVKMIKAGIT